MCYDIKVSLERQLKVARNFGDQTAIDELQKKLMPYLNPIEREYYRVSGFDHPKVFLLDENGKPFLAKWGLVPTWAKTAQEAMSIQNSTLNARSEELEEKPSFREAYRSRRAVLIVDGFYEHHHKLNKVFPYYIQAKDNSPLILASIYETESNFSDNPSFSILTRSANPLMSEIHNNPKLAEPRMPLCLSANEISLWLNKDFTSINELGLEIELKGHTVRRFAGRPNKGNLEDSAEEVQYAELQKGLFD